MSKLKPCPFCGSQFHDHDQPSALPSGGFAVLCEGGPYCDSSGPLAHTGPEAVEKWNRRAARPEGGEPETGGDVEALKDLARRLRGIYEIPVGDGGGLLDGKDTFTREFPDRPPIQLEAAKVIESLIRTTTEAKGEK